MLGTTVKAIRTYHARGLVPEPPRDESGYRRYDAVTLVRLARVRRLRDLGLPLSGMEPLLAGGDGGAALRVRLQVLDDELAAEARRLRTRRSLIAELLREGVDDPIAVTAADVWEEHSVSWLRRPLPDLTPEEELSERRFQRAISALAPLGGEPPPTMPEWDLDPGLQRRVADAHRRFHALADARADDPRVAALIPEMSSALVEMMLRLMSEVAAPEPPEDGAELMGPAFAAALETLPPAQREVLGAVFAAMLEQVAEQLP